MLNECSRKNYYFSETMKREILSYNIVSFDVFDTALLFDKTRDVFFENLAQHAEKAFGIPDFAAIRISVEEKVRQSTIPGQGIASFDAIYSALGQRYPEFPANDLKELERNLCYQAVSVNSLIKELFDFALENNKRILFLSDCVFNSADLSHLLNTKGYSGYEAAISYGQTGASKSLGTLYNTVLEWTGCSVGEWLHIGADRHADGAVPRNLGITAAAYRSPQEWASHYGVSINNVVMDEFTEKKPPDESIVIDVDDVSMMFNMSSEKVDNIKEYVIRMLKHQLMFREFWALNSVGFRIHKGEKVGLIGLNGSGKSTMLKIVSGVLKPTKGKVSVVGSIAPMIELGAGFDMELSARENVFLNGAILGFSRKQMEKYYDEIIDFAELNNFQDIAIKNYSSGMIARLGFAIATCHVPDILIIDEILSVGDFEFQKKCHKKMNELTQNGATVLFVSHSPDDIINMCDRAIWLDHGKMIADGEARFIVEKYLNR